MPMLSTDRRRIAPRSIIELGVHQCRGGVYDIDRQAPALQAARGLQAEQAAADDTALVLPAA